MFPKKIIIAGVALVAAAAVNAAEPTATRIDQLEAAKESLARDANRTKGGPRQLLLQEERRVEQLIEDLQRGRPVDPAAIDRALQRGERGGL